MESIFPEHIVECIANCFSDQELVAHRALYPRLDVGKALRQRRIARKALKIAMRWHFAAILRRRGDSILEQLINVTDEQIRFGVDGFAGDKAACMKRLKTTISDLSFMLHVLRVKGWFDKEAAVPLIGGMSEFFPFLENILDDDLLNFIKGNI